MNIGTQTATLFLLAISIACVSWTVTHEEIFREAREYCAALGKKAKTTFGRKFFYVFTCEYCFSHYVAVAFLLFARFTLLYAGWRGYVVSGFALVWVANFYMSLFYLLRTDIKSEQTETTLAGLKKQR